MPETISKGVRFPKDLAKLVAELADKQDRDFSRQVIHMLRSQIELEAKQSSQSAANPAEKLA